MSGLYSHTATPGIHACQNIREPVTDHPGPGKVETHVFCRLQQHSRPGLAVRMFRNRFIIDQRSLTAKTDSIQFGSFRRNLGAKFVVNFFQVTDGKQASSDCGLIRDQHTLKPSTSQALNARSRIWEQTDLVWPRDVAF